MPAYLIANVSVLDADKMKEYLAASPGIIQKFGGRYLARGGEVVVAEGEWSPIRLVIVEFPSLAKIKEFWASPEYAPLKALRQGAADTEMVFVDGLEP
jgi:uncharacterized protein (DUF1330 family)